MLLDINAQLVAVSDVSESRASDLCQEYTEAIGPSRQDESEPGLELIDYDEFADCFTLDIEGLVPDKSDLLYLTEYARIRNRLYWEEYERGPWGDIALSVGWLMRKFDNILVYYISDGPGFYTLFPHELQRITRHWVLWGHKPYRDASPGEEYDYGDYDFKSPDDYPWYSLAYAICRNGGQGRVNDWSLMPEPDLLTEHKEAVSEALSESVVEEHRESLTRALRT